MPLIPEPKPLTVTVTIQHGDDEPEVRTYTPTTATIDGDSTTRTRVEDHTAYIEHVRTYVLRMEESTIETREATHEDYRGAHSIRP